MGKTVKGGRTMNDADIQQAQLEETAARHDRLRRKGICTHGWHEPTPDGRYRCKLCGKVWDTEEAAFQAHEQYL